MIVKSSLSMQHFRQYTLHHSPKYHLGLDDGFSILQVAAAAFLPLFWPIGTERWGCREPLPQAPRASTRAAGVDDFITTLSLESSHTHSQPHFQHQPTLVISRTGVLLQTQPRRTLEVLASSISCQLTNCFTHICSCDRPLLRPRIIRANGSSDVESHSSAHSHTHLHIV